MPPNTLKQQALNQRKYWKQFEQWMPEGYRLTGNRMLMHATFGKEGADDIVLTEQHVDVIFNAMRSAAGLKDA